MVKRKGRAARKQQRDKAAKAVDHGLPAPELAPKPQKTRRVGGDTIAAAVASEKAGRAGPRRRRALPADSSKPVVTKVLIGAAVALALVYGLSQLRKSGDISSAPQSTSTSVVFDRSLEDESSVEPAGESDPETMDPPGEEEGVPSDQALEVPVPSEVAARPEPPQTTRTPISVSPPSSVSAPVPASASGAARSPSPIPAPPPVTVAPAASAPTTPATPPPAQ